MRNQKIYIGILFIFLILLGIFDSWNYDNFIYHFLNLGPLKFYDLPIWSFLGVTGTLLAVIVALHISFKSEKHLDQQLTIEQSPYVIVKDGIDIEGVDGVSKRRSTYLELKIKNIGRGPALRITVTDNENDPNKPLFENISEPHSCDLGSSDEKNDWKINAHNLEIIISDHFSGSSLVTLPVSEPIYLFIHYQDQMKNPYITKVKFQKTGSEKFLKVMENKLIKDSSG